MPAKSRTSSWPVVLTCARSERLRPGRPYGQNVLQHPGHLRRVRGRPDPAAHPRGHGGRACTGKAERETAEAVRTAAKGTAPDARHGRLLDQRSCRAVFSVTTNRLPGAGPATDRHLALKKARHLSPKLTISKRGRAYRKS